MYHNHPESIVHLEQLFGNRSRTICYQKPFYLSSFATASLSISRITNDHVTSSDVSARSYANQLTVLNNYLVHSLVEHVSAAIHCTEPVHICTDQF